MVRKKFKVMRQCIITEEAEVESMSSEGAMRRAGDLDEKAWRETDRRTFILQAREEPQKH